MSTPVRESRHIGGNKIALRAQTVSVSAFESTLIGSFEELFKRHRPTGQGRFSFSDLVFLINHSVAWIACTKNTYYLLSQHINVPNYESASREIVGTFLISMKLDVDTSGCAARYSSGGGHEY